LGFWNALLATFLFPALALLLARRCPPRVETCEQTGYAAAEQATYGVAPRRGDAKPLHERIEARVIHVNPSFPTIPASTHGARSAQTRRRTLVVDETCLPESARRVGAAALRGDDVNTGGFFVFCTPGTCARGGAIQHAAAGANAVDA
jgi:hypothetical protein